ncbi:MAG: glycosyltransferase, partial [Victivallales bacterium]|nr:glycosyltransferase [Victivallales bacterium]
CRSFLQALYLAGHHIGEGAATSLFAFYSDFPARVALLASRFSGVDFNFNASGKDIARQPQRELLEKLRSARFVTVQATGDKNRLQAAGKFTTPVYIFCHGIDLDRFPFPHRLRHPMAPYRLLTVAALDGRQNLDLLLHGVAALRRQGVDCRYTFIGSGPEREVLSQLIVAEGLQDMVVLKENISREALLREYGDSDLLLFLGREAPDGSTDDLPDVLLESMACGLPVIASPQGAIPEVVEHEETGLLLPDQADASVLADLCRRLLEDEDLREMIIMKARLEVESHYDLLTRIAEFVDICEENDLLA